MTSPYTYTAKEKKLVAICRKCIYSNTQGANMPLCDYLYKTGKRRPCKGPLHSADGKCECFTTRRKKKSPKRPMNPVTDKSVTFKHKGLYLIQSKYNNHYSIYADTREKALLHAEYDKPLTRAEAEKKIEAYIELTKEEE